MNVSLTPALEKFVQDKVATGLYNSVSEVIREAIRLLISTENVSQERLKSLYKDIDTGLNDPISHDGSEAMEKLLKRYE